MYSKEQIEKAFDTALGGQKIVLDQMRASMPQARDTQACLNNLITFIGCGLKDDLLKGFKEAMMRCLEGEKQQGIRSVEHKDRVGKALERLGVRQ